MSHSRTQFVVSPSLFSGLQFPQDDSTLHMMARKMYEMMGKPAAGEETTDTFNQGVDDECEKWLAGLTSSTAGQRLLDHLNHIEAAPHMRSSSAFEQAATFRRVFMYALGKTPSPFGLPKKLPKYIVIANFSGERLLLYSSNSTLISMLTLDMTGANPIPSYDGVEQIIAKAETTDDTSVLLTYALPFQLGIDSLHWECRLLTKQGTKYTDNELSCNTWDRHATATSSTNESESQMLEILDAQVGEFSKHMNACDLDVKIEKIDGINPEEVTDAKQAKLMTMITMLQNERRKMIEAHKTEIDELKAEHQRQYEKSCQTMKASFDMQATSDSKASERIEQLELELQKKEKTLQDLKSSDMIKSETIENMKRAAEEKSKEFSKEVQSLKSQIRKTEQDKSAALKKQEVIHQQLHDEAERKLQRAKQSEAVANESMNQIRIIERAFEGVSSEKEYLESELKFAKKNLASYKLRLAFQIGINFNLTDMTRRARMSHMECNEEVKQLQAEVNQLSADLEEAKSEKALLESKESKSDVDCVTSCNQSEVSNTDTADAQIQTDILPESLKIGELEAETVKLKDEIIQLKVELGKAKSKNIKKVQPLIMTSESPCQPSIPPQPPALSEQVLEGTIQQLHLSLNTITDLARQCKTHEQSAREAWSKVHAYESMNAQQMPHAGAYHVPFMYMQHHGHPPHNGHYP